jgi:elongation factor G
MAAANGNGGTRASGPRCIALVGPFQSGKTTLLEAILARTGAIQRQGTVDAGNTVGDSSNEARHHKMSVELSVATTDFMGDSYTFIDCPGSVEFIHDMRAALPAVDAAVVVCEADEKKVPQLQLILRELEDLNIPRFLFLNKIDKADANVTEALQILQPASRKPLVCGRSRFSRTRSSPASWTSRWSASMSTRSTPRPKSCRWKATTSTASKDARFSMLETLADHDDELMEQLLAEDIPPPRDKVFDDLAKELREGLVVPVLMGVGDPHQRRAAPAQGAAARVAECRDHGCAASASMAATPSPM